MAGLFPDNTAGMERIDKTDSTFRSLLEEVKRLRAENRRLRQQLGISSEPDGEPRTASRLTKDQRVGIFTTLFQGRRDVYARRWVSSRTGKSGYSPARSRDRFGKEEGKGELLPLTDQVLISHLTGKLVVGVYPLLLDETCHFVAVDFDKATWREDSAAFKRVGRELGVSVALERSRSGNGAHAWIFFEGPLEASLGRRLATALLTRTMESHHQLTLDSYDRLFPSQDTLPKGGFGNLIALPLQGQPRRAGNTIFLDDQLQPIEDQWQFLSSIKRIGNGTAREIVSGVLDSGPLIGVRMVGGTDGVSEESDAIALPLVEDSSEPAFSLASKRAQAVLENRLTLEKGELSPKALNHVIRLASFQNPEFYRFQAMRLSTFGKPRIISCAQDSADAISLPRGCLTELLSLLKGSGATVDLVDKRNNGIPLQCEFKGRLTRRQNQALESILREETGVLVAPPAFGKTVVAAAVIAARQVNTLVVVHRRQLMDQWRARLRVFLPTVKEVGEIGGGKKRPTGLLDVAMLQTLNHLGNVKDLVEDYGQIIVDECHHISAFRFEQVLNRAKAKHVLGLTATPYRRDGHHPIILMQCGPIQFRVDPRTTAKEHTFRQVVTPRTTEFCMQDAQQDTPFQQIMAALALNPERNDLIFDDVVSAIDQGRHPLLLTERVLQLEYFETQLRKFCKNVLVCKGGQSKSKRAELLKKLSQMPADEERLILATGRCIGEGFDDPLLDTLFLAMPVSWKGLLHQYLGRLQRHHAGKSEVVVYDYVDRQVAVLNRMFEKRCRGYRSLGFEVQSA